MRPYSGPVVSSCITKATENVIGRRIALIIWVFIHALFQILYSHALKVGCALGRILKLVRLYVR